MHKYEERETTENEIDISYQLKHDLGIHGFKSTWSVRFLQPEQRFSLWE